MWYAKHEAKEASKAKVRGVWAAITTPFTADEEIDEAGLRANVERLIDDYRVSGVFCVGAMGEFWSLTDAERRRVAEIVVDAAAGRIGVIVHTGHHSVRDAISLSLHAQEIGADFASVFTPYYPEGTEAGIARWFRELTDNIDIGLWLIDTGVAGPGLSVDLTVELASIPNVCGLKVARSDEHYDEVLRRTGGSIVLSDPREGAWIKNIQRGQQTFMSSPAPYLLQTATWTPMADYTDAAQRGDVDEAKAISATMDPLRQLFGRARHATEPYAPAALIKAWSGRLGLAAGPVRTPADLPADLLAGYLDELDALVPQLERAAA